MSEISFLPLKPAAMQQLRNCIKQKQKKARVKMDWLGAFEVSAAICAYIDMPCFAVVASVIILCILSRLRKDSEVEKAILDGKVRVALIYTNEYGITSRREGNICRRYAHIFLEISTKLEFPARAINRVKKDRQDRIPVYIGKAEDRLFAFTSWELQNGMAIKL